MNRPYPWTDGYVSVVTDQIIWNYSSISNRIEAAASGLSFDRMRHLLENVRSAGNLINDQTPSELSAGTAVATEIDELFSLINDFRAAGATYFHKPDTLPDWIFCTCAFPREYRGLPDSKLVPGDEVELIHMGDMRSTSPDWLRRSEVVNYPKLLRLTLFNCGLGGQTFGMNLRALTALQALDLRENGLTQLPQEVLACEQLSYLNLGDNPLAHLPELSFLRRLRYLGVAQTEVPVEEVEHARVQVPNCEIRG